jgi:hypothetical protein
MNVPGIGYRLTVVRALCLLGVFTLVGYVFLGITRASAKCCYSINNDVATCNHTV